MSRDKSRSRRPDRRTTGAEEKLVRSEHIPDNRGRGEDEKGGGRENKTRSRVVRTGEERGMCDEAEKIFLELNNYYQSADHGSMIYVEFHWTICSSDRF